MFGLCSCGVLVPGPRFVGAPAIAPAVAVNPEYDPYPQYAYAYNIQDALTGDQKSQQESREGDVVKGSYQLVEPDGFIRTVTYTADPLNGFNAIVDRSAPVRPAAVVPAPLPFAAPAPLPLAAPLAPFASRFAAPPLARVF